MSSHFCLPIIIGIRKKCVRYNETPLNCKLHITAGSGTTFLIKSCKSYIDIRYVLILQFVIKLIDFCSLY